MTKLEQAARQALEALESCNVGNWSMAFDEFAVVEAITALREALAEQAEQEFTAEQQDRFAAAFDEAFAKAGLPQKQPVKQEPECKYKEAYIIWQDKTEWVQETAHLKELGMHRADVLRQRIENLQNAATHPVRTKDLTDDEILAIAIQYDAEEGISDVEYGKRVIAAYKEKNNANNNS